MLLLVIKACFIPFHVELCEVILIVLVSSEGGHCKLSHRPNPVGGTLANNRPNPVGWTLANLIGHFSMLHTELRIVLRTALRIFFCSKE